MEIETTNPNESPGENENDFRTFVVEANELKEHITALQKDEKQRNNEVLFNRFALILEKYQEQPQLLDPLLEGLVTPLMNLARNSFNNIEVVHRILKIVYVMTKVRGYKTVERFFPHEVVDFEPTFELLKSQKKEDFLTWETRYVLLLWVSVLVLIPFDISTIDSQTSKEPLLDQIVNLAKSYLKDTGKCKDAASILLSRAITRPDFGLKQLPNFLIWCNEAITANEDAFLITGVVTVLSAIFKRGKRQELLDKIPVIYKNITKINNNSVTHRKLFIKLIQRIGLTFMKPRVAAWRYQRGNRSLLQNLGKSVPTTQTQNINEEEEDEEISSEIEDIIGHLLNGLRDKDTVVRWSAAKGIGRITNRLPLALGDDVVGSVLELFSVGEGDTGWHGGCLALAELARRGLLLPNRLANVIPLIVRALQYDERRGSHSVGAHVRDAACYVCWAFARAYSPDIMFPHVFKLSTSLMVTAIFDREVNCRRAAAAAFQENVGRQGNFPHGIDIVTEADYFSLSNRTDAYLKISPNITKFEEYRKPMIDDLADVKIQHWDRSLRELTSKALAVLTQSDPSYFHDVILPKMIAQSTHSDLNLRHGSILAVAEILQALSEIKYSISPNRQEEIVAIIPNIEKNRLYRGKGGEIIRYAACKLIESIAVAKLPVQKQATEPPTKQAPVKGKPIKEKSPGMIMQDTLDENLKHPSEEIQKAAVAALKAFTHNCYSFPPKKVAFDLVDRFISVVLKDPNPASRRGYGWALGVLPRAFVIPKLDDVINALIEVAKIQEASDQRDAETRRNAVQSLGQFALNVGIISDSGILEIPFDSIGLSIAQSRKIFDALLYSSVDYCIDNRGDVGSWVRDASLQALEKLAILMVKYDVANPSNEPVFTPTMCHNMLCRILQQCVEKIDRIRGSASSIFFKLIHLSDPIIPYIQNHEELKNLFPKNLDVNWSVNSQTFPIFVQILQYDPYRDSIILGLLPSVAGVTQSLVLDPDNILLQYVKKLSLSRPKEEDPVPLLKSISESLLRMFKQERVVVPLIKVITQLISQGCFDSYQPSKSPFIHDLMKLMYDIIKSNDIVKVMVSIYLYCWLLLFEQPVRNSSFHILLILLCHKYPKVRKVVADELYIRVMTDEFVVPSGSVDQILSTLSETRWDDRVTPEVREKRDALYGILNLNKADAPPLKIEETDSTIKLTSNDNYKDFVKDVGY